MFVSILCQIKKKIQIIDNIIQLLTFVEVTIVIYRSNIYDIYRSRSWGKYLISYDDRSLY